MLRSRSRGTTQNRYDADPLMHQNGQPVLDDRNRPRFAHDLLMPLVTHFLGSKEDDQLCVKGCFWAKDPEGELDPPRPGQELGRDHRRGDGAPLYERARELGPVRLVSVEDVQRTDQGDTDHAVAAFLLRAGRRPAGGRAGPRPAGAHGLRRGRPADRRVHPAHGARSPSPARRWPWPSAGRPCSSPTGCRGRKGPIQPTERDLTPLAELTSSVEHLGEVPPRSGRAGHPGRAPRVRRPAPRPGAEERRPHSPQFRRRNPANARPRQPPLRNVCRATW